MRNKFVGSPVTVDVEYLNGERDVHVGSRCEYGRDIGGAAPHSVIIWTRGDAREIPLATIDDDVTGYVKATHWPEGADVHIRESLSSDAVDSPAFDRGIPLPLEVIATMVAEPNSYWSPEMEVSLNAVTDDDGFVATMLLVSSTALYARYDNSWVPITDPDLLDGMDIVEVSDPALALYDGYESSGRQIHVAALEINDELDASRMPDPPVTASVSDTSDDEPRYGTLENQIVEMIERPVDSVADVPRGLLPAPLRAGGRLTPTSITSIDDVAEAITAATHDPSLRWFVERRARALGYEDSFPW